MNSNRQTSLVMKLASRFVLDRRSIGDRSARGFVSFISVISVLGLALGVTALLVVTSVMNGFERELKNSLTAFHGHVILFSRGESLTKPEKYIDDIEQNFPDVVAVTPYIFGEVMLSANGAVSGAVVEGIDPATFSKVSRVGEHLKEGKLPEAPAAAGEDAVITVGSEIARKLKVKVGSPVILTVPFASKGDAPLVRKLKVGGVVHLGMFDYDSKYALVHINDVQKLFDMPGKINAFKILTKDAGKSAKLTTSLNDKYVYPLRARDWSSLNRNLFYAIQLQKWVISIILMTIILVASFNIISTLMMMVHDKRSQISMLKALGLEKRSVFLIFLSIGGVMSVLGTFMGLVFGRVLCAIVAWKSIIDLPGDIYVLSRLPAEVRPVEWALVAVASIGLALLSTVWPSRRVSRESPVEGLRYE